MTISKSQVLVFILVCAVVAFGITIYLNSGSNGRMFEFSDEEDREVVERTDGGYATQVVPADKPTIKTDIMAAGDIILSRTVGVKIREAGDNTLPFYNVKDLFRDADIAFATLDAPFYNEGPLMTEGMVFKVEPEFIEGLKISGIDVVSLAGNHFGDQLQAGMIYSLDWCAQNGIKTCGAGEDIYAAHEPAIQENEGVTFAFLSYNEIPPKEYGATTNTAGTAWMDEAQMTEDVKNVLPNVDVVIVVMHAGTEYEVAPTIQQQNFAHAAIDAGAKLVLGSHPHIVQPTEEYNDGFIIYSLGNFIFDQMWSQETMEGTMADCHFEGDVLKSVDFIPVIIENYNQPRLANEAEAEVILNRMDLVGNHVDFE